MPGPLDRWLADDNYRAKEKKAKEDPVTKIERVKCNGPCGKKYFVGSLIDDLCQDCWKEAHPEHALRNRERAEELSEETKMEGVELDEDDRKSKLKEQLEKLKEEEGDPQ